ncbi:hypothetical protein [Paenibacillus alba]|uniref:Glycosyl hydrolase family 32 N-terminal domain-containing protein n=1 Tax=Paenibacillus alba TaxID=1197127 RepID=A0ABU6G9B5_9BACL|nr:hypothetical protein [Paenibacillus alba]MEC0230796.1 hypothetical protein [Paenibacillus alba]
MMYVGFDGKGYQTALATSSNLLDWEHKAIILPRLKTEERWDHIGAAGSWMLLESNSLYDLPRLKKINNRYWMVYHAYPDQGYEAGGAVMGLAWTEDESLLEWQRLDEPVFSNKEGADWEKAGLYKCCVIEHDEKYWIFYNAKRDDEWPWKEETGLAVSSDLIHWERYGRNPVLETVEESFYSQFISDPCIKHDGQQWVNFAFGFDGRHAQGALAVSDDLHNWRIAKQPLITYGEQGELDEIHAHKSSVIYWNGVLYHFYCACRHYQAGDRTKLEVFEGQYEFRCIAVATSKPLRSE